MGSPTHITFLLLFVTTISILQTPAIAEKKSYIVYLGAHNHQRFTKAELDKVSDSHLGFLAKYLGSKEKAKEAIFVSYRRHINGFAAHLDKDVADQVSKDPNVISLFENKKLEIQTTYSWEYLSFEKNNLVPPNSLWKKAKFGEEIILANIDSGVWPESKSFSDEGYGPIPSRWRGRCDKGLDTTFSCNRKLIGARYYKAGIEAMDGQKVNPAEESPRDFSGHGTHTLTTAGGSFVPGVDALGIGNGTAKGGAPKVRLATYKITWATGSSPADAFKAMDHVIYDRVNVVSISMGYFPASPLMEDPIAAAGIAAIKHGILIVMAAGNHGPTPSQITNLAPWILTVGASTTDRAYETIVELGNGAQVKGVSISKPLPEDKLYPLITGEQAKLSDINTEEDIRNASLCNPGGYHDPEKAKGKILVCPFGGLSPQFKEMLTVSLGAVGYIMYNEEEYNAYTKVEFDIVPSAWLAYKESLPLLEYIKSTSNPTAKLKPPTIQLGQKPDPMMAFFSSRGPNPISPEILKPDLVAPGVNILAAWTPKTSPSLLPVSEDPRQAPFVSMSGTSMACPHVAGVAALLRAIHPKWSTGAIRSALMTTANPLDKNGNPIMDYTLVDATPFAYGAGHIQPDRAADPGLVYDLKMKDYLNFLCASGTNSSYISMAYKQHYQCPQSPDESITGVMDFNYPSITVPKLIGTMIVRRKLRNVGVPATYTARVEEPQGILVSVSPQVLKFTKTLEEQGFSLTLAAKQGGSLVPGKYVFGALVWSDGVHTVRSPITVATA